MIFGESLEFDDANYSTCAEAIPMLCEIPLYDVWIPSYLLPNRQNVGNPNVNKPTFFHTLEEHCIADCFSVYDEPDCQKQEASIIPVNDILDEISQNSSECLCNEKFIDKKLHNKTSISVSENNYFGSMGNLSDDVEGDYSSIKTKLLDESSADNISMIKTFSESLKDSLDELSSEDEKVSFNKDQIKNSDDNLSHPSITLNNSSRLFLKSLNGQEVENKYLLEGKNESELGITHADQYDNKECITPISDNDKNYGLDFDTSMDFDQGDLSNKKILDNSPSTTEMINYPLMYQRPTLEDTFVKKRNQREKKKNKVSKKNVLLETISLNDADFNKYEDDDVDEFYESILRSDYIQSYTAEYPSLPHHSKIISAECSPIKPATDEKPEMATSYLYEQLKCPSLAELKNKIEEQKTEADNAVIIVIENIPFNVNRNEVENLISSYGELKSLSLEPCEKFLKAYAKMDCHTDIDWIIECLNGEQPFGVSSEGECLKCYNL